jgi:hypothetical protein
VSTNDITGDAIRSKTNSDLYRNNFDAIFNKQQPVSKRWMIVKGAAETHWSLYFETNPADGLHLSYSAFNTYIGKLLYIENYYTDLDRANHDLKTMVSTNPSVGYAVVPVL